MHQPTDSQDINRRVLTISTVLIAFIMGAAALHWLRPVMIPFILALFFAYLLAPIIDWIEQRGVNRWLAIFVVFFVDLIGFILFFGLVSSSFKELSEDFPVHLERFKRFMDYSIDFFNKNGVNVGIDTLKQHIFELPFTKIVMGMTNTILKLLSNTFLILIFMVYLLMKPNPKPREGSIRAEIDHRIKRYIIIKVSLSAVTGILVALILSALRVDLAIFFGLMAFVLNFIPSVGSIIATLLPLPIVLLDPNLSIWMGLLAFFLPGAVQLTIGNVIEPKLQGDSLELHPITILLALIFWGMLWGIPGMFLAMPVTAVLRVFLDQLDLTRPAARLMAGHLGQAPVIAPPPAAPVTPPAAPPPLAAPDKRSSAQGRKKKRR